MSLTLLAYIVSLHIDIDVFYYQWSSGAVYVIFRNE